MSAAAVKIAMRPTTAVTAMSSGLPQRFVKADLCQIGGMIAGGHKSERRMLEGFSIKCTRVQGLRRRLKTVLNFECVEAAALARSAESSAAVLRKSTQMRLLVVEDEPRISELIKAALERAEFAVDTVRIRADAREALANTPYDAALLDL